MRFIGRAFAILALMAVMAEVIYLLVPTSPGAVSSEDDERHGTISSGRGMDGPFPGHLLGRKVRRNESPFHDAVSAGHGVLGILRSLFVTALITFVVSRMNGSTKGTHNLCD
jgi:hypothetical protein